MDCSEERGKRSSSDPWWRPKLGWGGVVRKLTAHFSVLEYWVPSSGTSALAPPRRGIRKGKAAEGETLLERGPEDRQAGAAGRQDQLRRECGEQAAWYWHSQFRLQTEQSRAARAGIRDFRFSDLGVNEPVPGPELAPRRKEGSPAAVPLGVGNPRVWSCSLATALFSLGVSRC